MSETLRAFVRFHLRTIIITNFKVEEAIREKEEIRTELDQEVPRKKARFMSDHSAKMRREKPSQYKEGKLQPGERAMRQRRSDTYQAAQEIHGGTDIDSTPGEIGLIETATRNCSTKGLYEGMCKSKKISKHVIPKIFNSSVQQYEKSDGNMTRSVAVYYSGGVMGKKKYRSVYKDSSYRHTKVKKGTKKSVRIKVNHCPLPRLVPYHKLMPFIKSIDIGSLYSVRETLCEGLPEEENVDGVYRKLPEMLARLAEYYLNQDQYELTWFNGETNCFYVSLGGDGAPFGKDDTACAWLISFLNIGRGVLSSNDNFLLFGGNCSENCDVMTRFIRNLMQEISEVETQTFSVNCNGSSVEVKFCFSELPNDMKMLCYLAGELSNSARYFSTFGNVSGDCNSLSGSFGHSNTHTWKPWNYQHRVKVAQKVQQFKQSINKKLAASTKRSRVTTYISSLKSRQEFVPLVGKLIDKAHADPLHLKNNACALAHRYLLNEVILLSSLKHCPSVLFSQLPKSSPFVKYITAMKQKCNLTRLAKRVIRWFDETKSHGKEFDYRFTGRDSRFFLHNFMLLISAIDPGTSCSGRPSKIYHCIAYLCLCLRDCVSLFSRVDITDQEVAELRSLCFRYFRANVLFFKVNPTVWTVGHVVPVHTECMKGLYGLGLGLNSMEGREAKHIFISKYSTNTLPKYRWEQIFLHEFVSLLWLRERCYNISKPVKSSHQSYLPKRVVSQSPDVCYCGMAKEVDKEKCYYCSHPLRAKILASIEEGKDKCFS